MTALARTTASRNSSADGRTARPAVRAVVALLSAAALACLAGCSASSTSEDGAGGSGVSDQSGTATAAPPGKYQALPEPCGSVSRPTLTAALPQASGYAGTPALTFDTDRRVGCRWSGTADGASRTLAIDIERVVSYDPATSDDDKAHQDFAGRATTAHVPDGTAVPDAAFDTPQPGSSGAPAAGGGGATTHRISGIGDEAYLDDSLSKNPGGQGRDVTFVFRTANVLVTVDLTQQGSAADDSDLQVDVNQVAQELAKAITS